MGSDDYGPRFNNGQPGGAMKGNGYFGPLLRPDGSVMTEFSVGVEINDEEMEIPSIVPTLTCTQLNTLINLPDGFPPPGDIIAAAKDHAITRLMQDKPVFAGPGEDNRGICPDIKRR